MTAWGTMLLVLIAGAQLIAIGGFLDLRGLLRDILDELRRRPF